MKNNDSIIIPVEGMRLNGLLNLPHGATSLIIFSHGSESSRISTLSSFIAQYFSRNRMGTLLIDLLSKEEDHMYFNMFDVDLLTKRLIEVTYWIKQYAPTKNLSLGYFGAGTGAASALTAADRLPEIIDAIVVRGARLDLVLDEELIRIIVPTLFIVGELDAEVLALNKMAIKKVIMPTELKIIPCAAHFLDEPGALEQVADKAFFWFQKHLENVIESSS